MDSLSSLPGRKYQVVFVMGATGTGKSKLAIKLATHFGGEIVNSDKIQLYNGLDIITNKVTLEERAVTPHHLIGGLPHDADFTASDFRRKATLAVESILSRGRLPIVAGGSNSYIEELVEGANGEFKSKFECCFLWVDVDLPELHEFVGRRVDVMVGKGAVEEARGVFDPVADYSKGVRRSIGLPEMDLYFRREGECAGEEELERLLAAAIDEMKVSTCRLTCCQVEKIHRLRTEVGWDIKRIDATEVFVEGGEEVWESVVWAPGREIVEGFLRSDEDNSVGVEIIQLAVSVCDDGKIEIEILGNKENANGEKIENGDEILGGEERVDGEKVESGVEILGGEEIANGVKSSSEVEMMGGESENRDQIKGVDVQTAQFEAIPATVKTVDVGGTN